MAAVTQVRILVTADFCLLLGDFPQCTFLFLSSSKKKAVFTFAGPPTTILQSLTDFLHSFSWESFLSTPRRLPSMPVSFSKKRAVFTFAGPSTTILQSLTDILHSFSWESFLRLFSLAFAVTVLLMAPSSEVFFLLFNDAADFSDKFANSSPSNTYINKGSW